MRAVTNRLEAFSDGVIAIIITIMVLNIPLPASITEESIGELLMAVVVFFVSFIVVGSQWEKHQYLFCICKEVSGKIVWWNIIYLFFLSLMPLLTKWIIENPGQVVPAVGYDIVYLMVSISFHLLQNCIVKESSHEFAEEIKKRRQARRNGWLFFISMFIGIVLIFLMSFVYPTASIIFFVALPVTTSLFNLWHDRSRRIPIGVARNTK